MQLRAYCGALSYELIRLKESMESRYKVRTIRDVLQIDIDEDAKVFIFEYGTSLFWNVSYDDEKRIFDEIASFEISKLENRVVDDFEYVKNIDNVSFKIQLDTIYLTCKEEDEMLAISHGIAQSLKLASFEESIQKTIEDTKFLPESLAKSGTITLSRKATAKLRGRLFLEKSNILLHSELLDTPEFFWEYPELEGYYNTTISYLDVRPRIEVLNKKLGVIQELLTMLADEQNHKHSSFLEWIIIILIAFEILLLPFS